MDEVFERAAERDVAPIYELIRARIAWQEENGIEGWNQTSYLDRYPPVYFTEQCHAGTLYVLRGEDGRLCGAVVLLEEDVRWDGYPTLPAYYVHNLVSAPDAQGAGSEILRRTEQLARAHGKACVRLDCKRGNEAINRYYERAGYLACGECADGPYHGILREKTLSE